MLSRCQQANVISRRARKFLLDGAPAASTGASSSRVRRCVARGLNTESTSWSSNDSIFSSTSNWDEIFRKDNDGSFFSKSGGLKPARRQTMSERETKAVSGMLDMIFDKKRSDAEGQVPGESELGVGGGELNDLFTRVRRAPKPLRWSQGPSSGILDEKKEQMSRCTTDQELLEWTQQEVFGESQRLEEAAKNAVEDATSGAGSLKEFPPLQSPAYPGIIAHLMHTFRVDYKDPNLALFIFYHAKKLSVVSYVFGCSTEAYNELIETRWSGFRDLHGVHAAVNEMVVNGIPINSRTRKIVEVFRRDIVGLEMQTVGAEGAQHEIWGILSQIERLVATQAKNAPSTTEEPAKTWDQWKTSVVEDGANEWAFDSWQEPLPVQRRKSRRDTGSWREEGNQQERPRSRAYA